MWIIKLSLLSLSPLSSTSVSTTTITSSIEWNWLITTTISIQSSSITSIINKIKYYK